MNIKTEVLFAMLLISTQPLFAGSGDVEQLLQLASPATVQQGQLYPLAPLPYEIAEKSRGGFSFSMSPSGGSVSAQDFSLSVSRGSFNYQAGGYAASGSVSGNVGSSYRMRYNSSAYPGQTFTVDATYYGQNSGYGVSGTFMGERFSGTILVDGRFFPYSGAGGGVSVNASGYYMSGSADGSGMSKAGVTILTAFMSAMYDDAYSYVPPPPYKALGAYDQQLQQ